MRTRRRNPILGLCIILLLLGAAYSISWAIHIGGRWTPLFTWSGAGKLIANGKEYPLFLQFHPSGGASKLRFEGRRSISGLRGSGCLCTAPGQYQLLQLSGDIYGSRRTTEGSLVEFRLAEPAIVDTGQARPGYFDLTGQWSGPDLVLDDRHAWAAPFRSGLRLEHASVTLHWQSYWTCKSACAAAN